MVVDYYEGEVCGIPLKESAKCTPREINELMYQLELKDNIIKFIENNQIFVIMRFDKTRWNRLKFVQDARGRDWVAQYSCIKVDTQLPAISEKEIAGLAKIMMLVKEENLGEISWYKISGISY